MIDLDPCTLYTSHRFNRDFESVEKESLSSLTSTTLPLSNIRLVACCCPWGLSPKQLDVSPTAAYDAGVKFLSLDADARSTKSLFNIIGEPAITDRYWVFFQDHLRAQSKLWVEVVVLKVEKFCQPRIGNRRMKTLAFGFYTPSWSKAAVLLGGPWYESVVLVKLVPNKPDWHELRIWHL